MNFLSKAVLGPWVRFEDEATWRYCANEMLSYISLYATSGTSPITGSMSGESSIFSPVLGRALGICAAHGTLVGTQGRVFNQLIDRELEDLVAASQSAPVHDGRWERRYFEAVVMDTTARMQALTMYQIIRLFSDKARDLQKAAAHEALFASWARELQLQVQMLQQSAPSRGSAAVIGPAVDAADPKAIDAAYRAILISYAVRAVHSVLNDKTCAVWDDLFTLVMPASLSGQARLLYPEYVIQWEMKSTPTLYEDDRRLSDMVVAACKGVDVVVQQANS
ncbi:C6 finger domain-containing protein [Colletotrichum higginsianum]|nr:C6 finger domain-containing protein [Colletotrichum higginsianum]